MNYSILLNVNLKYIKRIYLSFIYRCGYKQPPLTPILGLRWLIGPAALAIGQGRYVRAIAEIPDVLEQPLHVWSSA
jgi:hypothetical protein